MIFFDPRKKIILSMNEVNGKLDQILQKLDAKEFCNCNPTQPVDPTNPTNPTNPTDESLRALGVNITWASDQEVDNPKGPEMFKHVRWFLMGSPGKDYDTFTPATHSPYPANILNIWSSLTPGVRDNVERILRLLDNYEGMLFLAPEDPLNRQWPGKSWTTEELGNDPRQAGRNLAKAYFDTFINLPPEKQERIILAPTNEEWLRADPNGDDRKAAYDLWRLGFMDEHIQHRSVGGLVKLSTGARQYDNRTFYNALLTESILDLQPEFLQYINSVNGYVNVHIHDRISDGYVPGTIISYGIDQLIKVKNWLTVNYPNIKIYVGEYSFQSSVSGIAPTNQQIIDDFEVIKAQIKEMQKYAEYIVWYQIEDHPWPEGKFTGTSAINRYSLFRSIAPV